MTYKNHTYPHHIGGNLWAVRADYQAVQPPATERYLEKLGVKPGLAIVIKKITAPQM